MNKAVQIGILALQGDFAPHLNMIERCGAKAVLIRRVDELQAIQGLILPGGESTTMTKLLAFSGLHDAIIASVKKGMAIWGTCAGCILLGRQGNDARVKSFQLLEMDVDRNAYGRQIESFIAPVTLKDDANPIEGVFIRAPIISNLGKNIEIIGTTGDSIVHIEAGKVWATTFHPELTNDERLHRRFIQRISS